MNKFKKLYSNKYYLLSLFVLLFLIHIIYFFTFKKNNNSLLDNVKFIGHATYGVDNIDYTNSVEGLKNGYNSGIRVMEVDFLFTSDGDLVLNHFWQNGTWEHTTEFLNKKIKGKYTSMSLDNLLEYMQDYEDLYIIIDTKEGEYDNDKNILDVYKKIISITKKYDEKLLERFIPQIYNFDTYKKINKLYNFKSNIFSLYKYDINRNAYCVEFLVYYCLLYNIDTITIPYQYIEYDFITTEKIDFIRSKNINIYINTINDIKTYKTVIDMGATGVYTDYLK